MEQFEHGKTYIDLTYELHKILSMCMKIWVLCILNKYFTLHYKKFLIVQYTFQCFTPRFCILMPHLHIHLTFGDFDLHAENHTSPSIMCIFFPWGHNHSPAAQTPGLELPSSEELCTSILVPSPFSSLPAHLRLVISPACLHMDNAGCLPGHHLHPSLCPLVSWH